MIIWQTRIGIEQKEVGQYILTNTSKSDRIFCNIKAWVSSLLYLTLNILGFTLMTSSLYNVLFCP